MTAPDVPLRIHPFDHGTRQAVDRPIEASAEQGVNHQVGGVPGRQPLRIGGSERAAPSPGRKRRIALDPLRLADQQYAHAIAAARQQPRRHKSVATVVPRPGNDHDPACGRKACSDSVGNRLASSLHEFDAGGPAGDSQPVSLGHFGVR
jgi:hypothetical protein